MDSEAITIQSWELVKVRILYKEGVNRGRVCYQPDISLGNRPDVASTVLQTALYIN